MHIITVIMPAGCFSCRCTSVEIEYIFEADIANCRKEFQSSYFWLKDFIIAMDY